MVPCEKDDRATERRIQCLALQDIRPSVGEKVLEIGAGTGNLTLQLVPRRLYWASDINPLYLTYLKNLGVNRPYMRVGYTDGEKGHSFPTQQKLDTVFGTGGPA